MYLMKCCRRGMTAAALLLALAACSTPPTPVTYAQETPKLDLQQYFNGTLDAHGIFQDRAGKVVKRFTVVMRASWTGEIGTLDEDFTYSDGSKQRRVWTLRKTAPGRFIGTAPDVIGEAVGEVAGNALRWQYVLALPVDGTVYHVDFEDWMFLMDDKVMLNRAAMSKFGFSLGAVTLSFSKRPQAVP
ncbi:hypothetical protein JAB6_53210 [Janthinobacterium sp. HH104]|uniref:DUF3833 domain-containing protein n=1 Tax=Janthinobacterium sp. HH104 TaxID=1537276 RepID=UPI000892CC0B|nr:DUF3833 domain-containing protein [Janthinobacterium sp. HH104]OEZ76523.1 hypothetical protein JAB6_53210 [Janthinobacterium sp. HH104]